MSPYKFQMRTFRVTEPIDTGTNISGFQAARTRFGAIFDELDQDREHFALIALNRRGDMLGYKVVGSGTTSACLISPSVVFRSVIVLGGDAFVMAHNHPSGSLEPSEDDLVLTRTIKRGAELNQ